MTNSMLCSGVFFLIGLGIVASGWMTYRRSSQAANWPSTTGEIITSEIIHSTGGKLNWSGHIVYQYSTAGADHVSKTVTFAELMGIRDTAKSAATDKVKKYPAGSKVTVYYDPQDPRRAVLEKGGDSSLFILGGIFILFALAIWVIG